MKDPTRIIVAQVDPEFVLTNYLIPFGIRDGEECTVVDVSYGFDYRALGKIHPGKPQLVLTSHTMPTAQDLGLRGGVDAFQVAIDVKGVNPEAIVIAFTSSRILNSRLVGTRLDGALLKDGVNVSVLSDICHAFLSGASYENIYRMVRAANP